MNPDNFSWVIEDLLAGSAFPTHKKHFEFLKREGIRHVVNFTHASYSSHNILHGINYVDIPVEEFLPPTLEQIIQFVDVVDNAHRNAEKVVCHCYWGRGRTGTMLAAYLVKHEGINARDAIDKTRQMRPFSVETKRQEKAVFRYAEYLNCLKRDSHNSQLNGTPGCREGSGLQETNSSDEEDDEFVVYKW